MVRVRFAPSPTGYLHIGGARTALFNWMYARAQAGQFILRIEDTDRERSKQEFVDEILNSLKWLGMDWDELYFQTQRFDIYKQYAQKLLDEGKAYLEGPAVILKIPEKPITLFDIIRGEIKFEAETIKEQVLIKSDGSPTYSFACVIDDALMEITHVIRGDDHISNTPKQILMYEALGFKIPKFAHVPLIMGPDGGRLSKRTGAVAVTEYQRMGFLAEGIVNYLMLLGWSPGTQEIIQLNEAVPKFSIKKVNKTAAVFSLDKLTWVNQQHVKHKDTAVLTDLLIPFIKEKGYLPENFDRKRLENIVRLYHDRIPTLRDFVDRADFVFLDEIDIAPELRQEAFTKEKKQAFYVLSERLSGLNEFTAQAAEETFRNLVKELGWESSALVHPVRVALTGKTVGPGLFETMEAVGKEKTVTRLKKAAN